MTWQHMWSAERKTAYNAYRIFTRKFLSGVITMSWSADIVTMILKIYVWKYDTLFFAVLYVRYIIVIVTGAFKTVVF